MSKDIQRIKSMLVEHHIMDGGRVSKLEANYTHRAIGDERCGHCLHFENPNACEIVEGFISPHGWCKFYESAHMFEKWGVATHVSPEERGKYHGKSKAELLHSYNALKKSGPHHKGSPEYGRMRELAFAIRAKGGWGKVGETITGKMADKDYDHDGNVETEKDEVWGSRLRAAKQKLDAARKHGRL